MFLRFVGVVLLAYVIWRWWRTAPSRPPQRSAPMVRCQRCDLYVPADEVVRKNGGEFCGARCAENE
ncbi:MAG: hypothetical protein JSR19_05485 [Proteobacteria bacterium]|nr:hypothetical protein [Pseudomonadota bacterium]HQR02841.1 PP0621 family protein [Rhodocyclaceae bacterium]